MAAASVIVCINNVRESSSLNPNSIAPAIIASTNPMNYAGPDPLVAVSASSSDSSTSIVLTKDFNKLTTTQTSFSVANIHAEIAEIPSPTEFDVIGIRLSTRTSQFK